MSGEGDQPLTWKAFPLADQPWRGLLGALVIPLTAWFIWVISESRWLTGLAAFVQIASLSSFYFPTRYTADRDEIRVANPFFRRSRPWKDFRAMSLSKNRLLLRTLPGQSRLDHYRGMLLLLDPSRRDEITTFVKKRLQIETESDDSQA